MRKYSHTIKNFWQGIVCSGIAYYVQAIVIRERGPVFVTSFSPLCMIIVAALGSIVLAEKIHLGRYNADPHFISTQSKPKDSVLPLPDMNSECLVQCHRSVLIIYLFFLYFSIIGAILIVFGLYTFVWAKSRETPTSKLAALTDEKSGTQEILPITDSTRSIITSSTDCKDGTVAAGVAKINP